MIEFESLLATIGVIRPKIRDTDFKKSFELPEKLAKRLRAWIFNPVQRPFKLPFEDDDGEQRYEPEELWKKLGNKVNFDDELAALEEPFDKVEFTSMVNAARSLLSQRWPLTASTEFLDDATYPPSDDEAQDWLAQIAVVEDPRRLFDELEMETLMPEQVSAFSAVYPELYKLLKAEAHQALTDRNAKDPEIELTDGAESALQVFLGIGQAPSVPSPPPEDEQAPEQGTADLKSKAQQSTSEKSTGR